MARRSSGWKRPVARSPRSIASPSKARCLPTLIPPHPAHEALRARLDAFATEWSLPRVHGREDLRHSLLRRLDPPTFRVPDLLPLAAEDPLLSLSHERARRMQPAVDVLWPQGVDRRRLLIGDRPGLDSWTPRQGREMVLPEARARPGAPRWKLRTEVWLAWRLYRATRGDNAAAIAASENWLKRDHRLPPRLELWQEDAATEQALRDRERARRRDLAAAGLLVDPPPPETFDDLLRIPPIDLGRWELGIRGPKRPIAEDIDLLRAAARQRLPVGPDRPTTVDAVQESIRSWYRALGIPKPHPRRHRP